MTGCGGLRLLLAVALVVSCGGKVIVESGVGGGAETADDDASPICATPDPVGELTPCGGTAGAGAGAPSCESALCDAEGNEWVSLCEDDSCRCLFNGQQRCNCVLNEGGQFCGAIASCCPSPFPD